MVPTCSSFFLKSDLLLLCECLCIFQKHVARIWLVQGRTEQPQGGRIWLLHTEIILFCQNRLHLWVRSGYCKPLIALSLVCMQGITVKVVWLKRERDQREYVDQAARVKDKGERQHLARTHREKDGWLRDELRAARVHEQETRMRESVRVQKR